MLDRCICLAMLQVLHGLRVLIPAGGLKSFGKIRVASLRKSVAMCPSSARRLSISCSAWGMTLRARCASAVRVCAAWISGVVVPKACVIRSAVGKDGVSGMARLRCGGASVASMETTPGRLITGCPLVGQYRRRCLRRVGEAGARWRLVLLLGGSARLRVWSRM